VFPRRTYTNEDGSLSLRDAGFLPNVSLNVHILKHVVDPESEDITAEGDTDNQSLNESIQGNDSNSDMDPMEVDDTAAMDPHRPPANNASRNWARRGIGHRLIDPPFEAETPTITTGQNTDQGSISRRSHLLSAIEQRASVNNTMNREIEQQRGGLERHSKELRDICTNNVSVLLSQHSTASNRYLKNLSDVSSDVAERLVKNLKEKGKLNASTLRKLTDHWQVVFKSIELVFIV
ncbi:hypothetical protein CU098_007550, partial [Rhizopus stolonifer]